VIIEEIWAATTMKPWMKRLGRRCVSKVVPLRIEVERQATCRDV
jgi:hypothetical protein